MANTFFLNFLGGYIVEKQNLPRRPILLWTRTQDGDDSRGDRIRMCALQKYWKRVNQQCSFWRGGRPAGHPWKDMQIGRLGNRSQETKGTISASYPPCTPNNRCNNICPAWKSSAAVEAPLKTRLAFKAAARRSISNDDWLIRGFRGVVTRPN
jgi:hypothetical protein